MGQREIWANYCTRRTDLIIIRENSESTGCAFPQSEVELITYDEGTLKISCANTGVAPILYDTPEQARVAFEHISRNFGQETIDVLTPEEAEVVIHLYGLLYSCGDKENEIVEWAGPYYPEWAKAKRERENQL